MKKIVAIVCTLGIAYTTFAQSRTIIMPEEPVPQKNIAEMDKGYWCAGEVLGGYTMQSDNFGMVGATFTNGYRFNQYIKVGAGLGVLYYPKADDIRRKKSQVALPLFVNARGNMLSDATRRTVPFWSLNAGWAFPDGAFVTPTVGLRIGEKRSAFLVGVSYTLRHIETKKTIDTDLYSGVFLKFGYEF